MRQFRHALSPGRRNAMPALAALAVAAIVTATPVLAEPISVTIDRAKVMRISQPADVVIIGNPAIADATIQDNRTLIISGRSYGTTNLIILDAKGNSIADALITVEPSNDQVVTVYRRASRETLSCTPDCTPVLSLGDNSNAFDLANTQIQAVRTLTETAAQH